MNLPDLCVYKLFYAKFIILFSCTGGSKSFLDEMKELAARKKPEGEANIYSSESPSPEKTSTTAPTDSGTIDEGTEPTQPDSTVDAGEGSSLGKYISITNLYMYIVYS